MKSRNLFVQTWNFGQKLPKIENQDTTEDIVRLAASALYRKQTNANPFWEPRLDAKQRNKSRVLAKKLLDVIIAQKN